MMTPISQSRKSCPPAMASYGSLFILGFMIISSGCCSCVIPRSCSYCSFWDHHRNKELYQVVCQDGSLTTIPNNLTNFLGNFLASYNNITNITRLSFVRYSYLKSLILDHNQLEYIEDGSFLSQAILEKLFLDFNRIRHISAGTFKGLIRLQRLSLRRNFISHLRKKVFTYLTSLRKLELGDNRISTIEEEAFKGLTNLESLYLGGNFLKAMSKDTVGILSSLTMLDLSFNLIHEVKENTFEGLSNLEVLHINDCGLKKLPKKEPFRGLNKLKELDLSTNPLSFLSFNTFVNFLKLETLNLSSTSISVMHDGIFDSLTSLKKLYLNNNPLLCDCNLRWMSKWVPNQVNSTNFILEMTATTRCAQPDNLAGKRLDTLTSESFLCSCEACTKNSGCYSRDGPDFCRCDSRWIGDSCNLVCNATRKHDQTCSWVNESCYCSHLLPLRNNSVTCSQNAVLLSVSNVLTCKCIDGFTGNGTYCTYISKCVQGSKTCHPDATCKDVFGSFRCVCKPGFEGNGFICHPSLPRPSNVQVKDIKTTAVIVMWTQANLTIEKTYLKCILSFKKVGAKYSWTNQLVNVTSPNSTVLKGLTPNTMYLLQVILVDQQGNRSPASPVVEFMTKKQKLEDNKEANATRDSGFAITLSLSVSGSFVAMALVVLLSWCTWRRYQKSTNKRSRPTVPQEMPLDVLPGRQENHSYVNPLNETPIQDKWEIPRNRLIVGEAIGEGEFGIVREGTLITEGTVLQVAIKSLKEHADRSDRKDFLRELDMFKGIGEHPNIVSLIGACTFDGPLLIITEYVSGGTLLDLLRSSRCSNAVYVNTEVIPSSLEQHVRLKLALDVAKGMAHIADHRFVHRDLAARNVLVREDLTAKITDFGLARDIYSEGIYLNSKGGRLPLKWMSPESLQDYVYTTQSDVWSFGILIWEIWSLGAMPYSTVLPHELLSKLMSGYRLEKPPDCSSNIYDIMKCCWNEEPTLRPSFCDMCAIFEEILSEDKQPSIVEAEEWKVEYPDDSVGSLYPPILHQGPH